MYEQYKYISDNMLLTQYYKITTIGGNVTTETEIVGNVTTKTEIVTNVTTGTEIVLS